MQELRCGGSGAYVIAQQYSSLTVVSLHCHSRKEKLSSRSKMSYIYIYIITSQIEYGQLRLYRYAS